MAEVGIWFLMIVGFLTCLYFTVWVGFAVAFRILANRLRRQGYFVVERHEIDYIAYEALSDDGRVTGHGRVGRLRKNEET